MRCWILCVADFSCKGSHLPDVKFAQQDKGRGNKDQQAGQCLVHAVEEDKGAHEADGESQYRRDGFRNDVGNVLYIVLQSVQYVSAMMFLYAAPLALHKMAEEAQLKHILTADTQNGSYPLAGEPHQYLG